MGGPSDTKTSAAMGERPRGVILAGGRAQRFGGADKAFVMLAGRPLIAYAVELLAPQCAGLIINANGEASRFAGFGLPVIADDVPDHPGPLAGVLAGLDYAARRRPEAAYVLTLSVDAPFAPADLAARLAEALGRGGGRVAAAASGGRVHPTTALWPAALGGELRRALLEEGERKVERFARRVGLATAEWPAEPYDPFFNVNAPEDLPQAEAILAGLSGERR